MVGRSRPRRRPKRTSLASLKELLGGRPAARAVPALRRPPGGGRWLTDQRLPGIGRTFAVYVPAGVRRRRTRVPLVLLLHGCTQTAVEFAETSRFTTVADRNRFVLLVPQQERHHHSQGCWRWYELANQRRGFGEPALLAALTRQVAAEANRWRIDPNRIYVAGLSAGGAMALTMAAAYPDLFAAVGVHSAPAYRSAAHAGQALAAMAGRTTLPGPAADAAAIPPLVIVQGTADKVVAPLNGERIAEQWVAHQEVAGVAQLDRVGRGRTDRGRTADGRRYTRVRWYTARRKRVLEYWLVEKLGHAWSGGRRGGTYSDPAGPRAATLMWSFFRMHRLAGAGVRDTVRRAG